MHAEIRVAGGDEAAEVVALAGWLRGERGLTGAVSLGRGSSRPESLSSAVDVISVALGSGGAGVALAQSLTAWLRSRRPDVKLTVTTGDGRSVQVEAGTVADPLPLLLEVVRQAGDKAP